MSNLITVSGNPSFAGATHHLYFPSSGVTFVSTIQSGADGYSIGSYAGSGNNGSPFSCYRDNAQQLYERYGFPCTKQYYCRADRFAPDVNVLQSNGLGRQDAVKQFQPLTQY